MNAMAVLTILAFAGTPAESIVTELPAEAGAFKADPVKTYKDPRLGASRSYKGPGETKVDVYVYDLGAEKIPDGVEGEAVQEAFKMARGDIKSYEERGFYQDLKMLPQKPREVTLAPGQAIPLLEVGYTFRLKRSATAAPVALTSYLLVTGMRGQIVKFRVSHPDDGNDHAKQIDTLVTTLIKSIKAGD